MDLLSRVTQFVKALEDGKTGDALSKFYHPDVLQVEYPNTLTRNGASRNLKALKEASEKGSKVLVKQTYEIVNSYVQENTVIIEAIWTGTLAIPLGSIPAGGQMKAWFCQVFEFEQGLIIRQRNYDCFGPF